MNWLQNRQKHWVNEMHWNDNWKTVFENNTWWVGHRKGTDLNVAVMDKRTEHVEDPKLIFTEGGNFEKFPSYVKPYKKDQSGRLKMVVTYEWPDAVPLYVKKIVYAYLTKPAMVKKTELQYRNTFNFEVMMSTKRYW